MRTSPTRARPARPTEGAPRGRDHRELQRVRRRVRRPVPLPDGGAGRRVLVLLLAAVPGAEPGRRRATRAGGDLRRVRQALPPRPRVPGLLRRGRAGTTRAPSAAALRSDARPGAPASATSPPASPAPAARRAPPPSSARRQAPSPAPAADLVKRPQSDAASRPRPLAPRRSPSPVCPHAGGASAPRRAQTGRRACPGRSPSSTTRAAPARRPPPSASPPGSRREGKQGAPRRHRLAGQRRRLARRQRASGRSTTCSSWACAPPTP